MGKDKDSLFASLPDNLPKEEEKQTKLPEELQGKSPEEMYDMLAQENERMLEEQKKQLEQQNSQATGGQQSQQGQRQGQGYQPPAPGSTQQYGQWNYGNQGTPAAQGPEEIDYWSEPDKFMEQQLNRRLQPIVNSTVQSIRGTNKNSFIRDVGDEDWQRYGAEVEQLIDSFSPEVQMHPNAYKQAYNIVMANHLDEVTSSKAEKMASEKLQRTLANLGISQEQLQEAMGQEGNQQPQGQQQQQPNRSLFQRNLGVPQVESGARGSAASSNPQPNNNGGGRRLNDREKRIAEEFGMTPKEYKEWADLNTDAISQLGG